MPRRKPNQSLATTDLTRLLDKAGIEYPEDDNELHQLFYFACERANEYPIFETAVSVYYHLDRIIESWAE